MAIYEDRYKDEATRARRDGSLWLVADLRNNYMEIRSNRGLSVVVLVII